MERPTGRRPSGKHRVQLGMAFVNLTGHESQKLAGYLDTLSATGA